MKANFFIHAMASLAAAVLLIGCGGGGSEEVASEAPPIASAGPAQTILAGASVQLEGSAAPGSSADALSYRWTVASTPPGSGVNSSSLSGANTARPSFVPDAAGAYVLSLVVSSAQVQSQPVTVTVTAVSPDTVSISADQAEPMAGAVVLSLPPVVAGSSVRWYLDLREVAAGSSFHWDTRSIANGPHQVLARIPLADGKVLDIKRTVEVSNSSVTISALVNGSSDNVTVDVRALSPFGITSVSASLDGVPIGFLDAPNTCSRTCRGQLDIYTFTINGRSAGSGAHTVVVTAFDKSGSSQLASVSVPISNPPTFTQAAPLDGAFAYGRLLVSGSVATDKVATVTVGAMLGDVPFLTTTGTSFSGSFDLAGLAAGPYTLRLTATDSTGSVTIDQRTVINASSPSLAHVPILNLGFNGELLAAAGDQVLYSADDKSIRLRDTVSGAELALQGGPLASAGHWQVDGGRVYAVGRGSDCVQNSDCVYQWSADGARQNLTASNPWAEGSYQQAPIAKAGYVLWCNDSFRSDPGSFTLYEVATGSYAQVIPPAGITHVGNNGFDLAVVDGVVHVFYWAGTVGSNPTTDLSVFGWRSDTRTSTRLSTPGVRSASVATDGSRVAWIESVPTSSANRSDLFAMPLSGGPVTTMATGVSSYLLRDGLLSWVESDATTAAVKANANGATTSVPGVRSSALYGSAAGKLVFNSADKLYSWTNGQPGSRLRADAIPRDIKVTASNIYFVMGLSRRSLYKIALE